MTEPETTLGPGGPEPDVSVIVPTRDRPELLARALRSIDAQDFDGEIEIIVVFDQEEPVRPEIELSPGRSLRLMTNQRSQGLAGARNSGILAARAALVAHCDDDDEWLPAKVAREVAVLADPAAEVVVTGTTIVYGDHEFDRVPANGSASLGDLLRSRMQEIHPSSIMARRANVIEGIGMVDEEIPGSYAEDYEWLLRAARRHPILIVPQPLVRVHWHQASFFSDRWPAIIAAVRYLLANYPEFRDEPKGMARLLGRMAFAYAASGEGRLARRWAWRSLKLDPRQSRAYLAIVVSTKLVSAESLMRLAHRTGRGI